MRQCDYKLYQKEKWKHSLLSLGVSVKFQSWQSSDLPYWLPCSAGCLQWNSIQKLSSGEKLYGIGWAGRLRPSVWNGRNRNPPHPKTCRSNTERAWSEYNPCTDETERWRCCVLCHMSHVRCHMSCITFFFFSFLQKGGYSRWRLC